MGISHLPLALTALFFGCRADPPLPADVVAEVSGEAIPASRYVAALAALAVKERAGTLTSAHRQRVLDALIDDALLREQATKDGLHPLDTDPAAAALAAHLAVLPPLSDDALRAWHVAHPEAFSRDPSWSVEALRFVGPDAEQRARNAHFDHDTPRLDMPAGPLPFAALEQYLGPTAARTATRLRPGEIALPTQYASGWLVVRLVARVPGETTSFEELRPAVRALAQAEAERKERDRYLNLLRSQADLTVNVAVFDAPIPPEALEEAARREAGR